MAPKTWLITGCSSGFGEEFVYEAIRRGDKAVATARGDTSRLAALKEAGAYVYSLDVTSPIETVKSTVAAIIEEIGTIDVLVNNAGYVQLGFTEEVDLDSWHAIFETNFFGSIKMIQAVLPHMRARRSGDVVFIGSMYGLSGQLSAVGYSATKFALEGVHDVLRTEVAQFGIRSLMFEPGICRTSVMQKTHPPAPANFFDDYKPLRDLTTAVMTALPGYEVGDPKKVVKVMVDLIRGEGVAKGREVPDRLILGTDTPESVKPKIEGMMKQWEEWDEVIMSTDCEDVAGREEPEYAKMIRSLRQ
ncbi:hypothetical protein N0V90_000354 [Kalmusia sp. IMI 367209]|nr:hypothetical protein N0V90_000354 [Kalmusia sp. IMI 367209]